MNWQTYAVKGFFFIGGFGAASWAPLVPFLKLRLAVEENVLGLLLLCIGVGSLFTMPAAGNLVRRFGCQRLLGAVSFLYAVMLLFLCRVDSFGLCAIVLLSFGGVMGLIDVAANIAAVNLEQAAKKRMMSGMHAMWSVGGFAGAGLFGVLMQAGFSSFGATASAASVILLLAAVCSHVAFLEVKQPASASSLFAVPRGIVAFIGIVALIAFLVEGAIMDWSGVFLTSVRNMDMALAGTGFSVFSAAMLLMRLTGDFLVKSLGEKLVVCGGTLVAFTGFMLVVFTPWNGLVFAGFFLIGLGMANIVPVFFSLIGRQSVMPVSTAVSAVGTLGYLGILMGPAAVGFIAHQTSLAFSFCFLAVLLLVLEGIGIYVYKEIK